VLGVFTPQMSTERPDQPEAGIPAAAEPASPPGNSPGNDKYGAAEYASIDKLKKTSSIRKATGLLGGLPQWLSYVM